MHFYGLLILLFILIKPIEAVQDKQIMDCIDGAVFEDTSPRTQTYLELLYGQDAWLGYPAEGETPEWGTRHGFKYDYEPTRKRLRLQFVAEDGRALQILQTSSGHYLAMPFKDLEPRADANGNWYGIHPCGAYVIYSGDFRAIWRSVVDG